MKNKFIILLIYFISIYEISYAEKFIFESSKIKVSDNGNILTTSQGKVESDNEDLLITAEKFKYIKSLDLLEAIDGSALLKKNNLKMFFKKIQINNKDFTINASKGVQINDLENSLDIEGETIIFDRKNNILKATNGFNINDLENSLNIEGETIIFDRKNNILKATNGIKINDLENSFNIETEIIVLDKKNNILNSPADSIINDDLNNIIKSKKFEYKLNENILKISKAVFKDKDNNNFKIDLVYINTKTNELIGKDVGVNLINSFLDPRNEPRLKGKAVNYKKNKTEISKGIFTICKKTDSCPPWQLSAEKITHNKERKNINYKNVWLKIYDVPVAYFPKFFHPDPTVKRQSGFLMPSFKNSPNKNTFLAIPYYNVIDDNKDFTFTPRLYAKDQLLIQNEYRQVNKESNLITDFSIFTDKSSGVEGHFFYNSLTNLNINNFSASTVNVNIETVSNDTYLQANKITSPVKKINSIEGENYELLETSINLDLISEKSNIKTSFIAYENLNVTSSDKYEFIFPKFELTKFIENKTKLNGDFEFRSNNYFHNYQTNIFEKVNTNDLIFNSEPKISKKGFYNDYDFIIRNSNTEAQKSKRLKEGKDVYLSGLFQFNSSYPLIKRTDAATNLLQPKISLKFSPNNTKNMSLNEEKLDINNIYSLDRISSDESLEGGISLTYGTDYSMISEIDNREILGLKFANNLRFEENDDLERNYQLGSKTSNFFGEISYKPNSYLATKYDVSIKNNFSDINYENLITSFKVNNFVTTFDYLNENDFEKQSYISNKTTYNINKFNNISFSTRKNNKTDLTEYYNLMYQYNNDCLAATIKYKKDYYSDRDIKPEESIFFELTIVPFGTTSTPNLKN